MRNAPGALFEDDWGCIVGFTEIYDDCLRRECFFIIREVYDTRSEQTILTMDFGMIITSLNEKNVALKTFIGRLNDVCGKIGWLDECFLLYR